MITQIGECLLKAHKQVYNVLLLNGNVFGSIRLGYTTNLKVEYHKCIVMLVFEKDRVQWYHKHTWMFCVDLK